MPWRKDKLAPFPLPEINDAMDFAKAASSCLTPISEGKLTQIDFG